MSRIRILTRNDSTQLLPKKNAIQNGYPPQGEKKIGKEMALLQERATRRGLLMQRKPFIAYS